MEKRILSEFVVRTIRTPTTSSVHSEIDWVCNCLGLSDPDEGHDTMKYIFRKLLKAARKAQGLRSTEIAEELGVSRGTIIYHLHKFLDSGLVVHHGNQYELRMQNLELTVGEIRKDMDRIMDSLLQVSREIDRELDLPRGRVENY